MTVKKAKGAGKPKAAECLCLGYESSDDDDDFGMAACVCGHSPEEHTFLGCEFTDAPRATPILAPAAPKKSRARGKKEKLGGKGERR